MKNNNEQSGLGWIIGESITLELDMVLNLISLYAEPSSFEYLGHLYRQIPEDVIQDFRELLPGERVLLNPLMRAARILNLSYENDYKKVSLSIRKTELDELTDRLQAHLKMLELKIEMPDTEPADSLETLTRLLLGIELLSLEKIGFEPFKSQADKEARTNARFISQIIRGGELEHEFWHCMDRFYYGYYLHWREGQKKEIKAQKNKALTHLKKLVSTGALPPLEWLRESHPIIERPSLIRGLNDLNCCVHFIAMPFNHFDMSHVEPGYCLFTISESAWKNKKWINNLQNLANSIKAISDPTRLTILRAIRHHHKYTTELAAFMNLSRPTISEHCKILQNKGFIETYTEGRKSYHRLKPGPIKELLKQLENYLDLPEMEIEKP